MKSKSKVVSDFVPGEKLIEFDDSLCSVMPDPALTGGKKVTFYKTGKFKIWMLISDMEDLIKKHKK